MKTLNNQNKITNVKDINKSNNIIYLYTTHYRITNLFCYVSNNTTNKTKVYEIKHILNHNKIFNQLQDIQDHLAVNTQYLKQSPNTKPQWKYDNTTEQFYLICPLDNNYTLKYVAQLKPILIKNINYK